MCRCADRRDGGALRIQPALAEARVAFSHVFRHTKDRKAERRGNGRGGGRGQDRGTEIKANNDRREKPILIIQFNVKVMLAGQMEAWVSE